MSSFKIDVAAAPSALPSRPTFRQRCSNTLHQCSATAGDSAACPSRRQLLATSALALTGLISSDAVASELSASSWLPKVMRDAAPSTNPKLNARLAADMLSAVYAAVQDEQVMSDAEFQEATFKLRYREYKYYYEANKDKLPRIPDLSDMSGGLSNPTYFNFVFYIANKVVASKLTTAEARTAYNTALGTRMMQLVAPDTAEALSQSRQQHGGKARPEDVTEQLELLLARLKEQGYVEAVQVLWASSTSDVPFNWETEGQLSLVEDSAPPENQLASFQVRLRYPADIGGSVSLRSEEDGFWSRAVAGMLTALLAEAGYQGRADEYFIQDQWMPPVSFADKVALFFGDPLMNVWIPWTPESLIQNWRVV